MKTARYLIVGSLILCFLPNFTRLSAASSPHVVRQDTKKPSLYWIHKDTSRKIFGLEDIVAFDWDKQVFQLKEEASMNMRLYPIGLIDPFEVRTGDQLLYEGALVSSLYSATYSGPSIWDTNRNGSLLYQIQAGYPVGEPQQDRRYCEPFKQILDQAGLLKTIDPNSPPDPIHCKNSDWLGEKDGLRVWLDVFTDTFIVDKPARFHFRLTSTKQYSDSDYVIETQTTLTANDGRYTQTVRRVFSVTQKYLRSAHPVGFILSADTKDGKRERIEAGPAQLGIEIAVRRVLDKKQGTYSDAIETLKIDPIAVEILPCKQNDLSSDAKVVMNNFREALQKQDWQKALTFCSDAVQKKTDTRPSKDFFETYTPLMKLIGNAKYYVSGMSTNIAGQHTGFNCFITLSIPDEQPCINWDWNLKKNEKDNTWMIDFPLISVTERLESEKKRLLEGRKMAQEQEQSLHKNLKTTLAGIQTDYVIGQPMLFGLEVTNISDSVVTLPYFSKAVMVNDPLSIKGPDGKDVLYIGGSAQTAGGQKEFEPDQTYILESNYDATTQYLITAAGDYTVQFRGQYQIPGSNVVTIKAKPGQLNHRQEITTRILSIMPEDWTISGVSSISQKSTDTSTHLNLMAYMDIAHMGFYGRMLLLVFIDPDEKVLQTYNTSVSGLEKLGQGPWGPVYALSKNADLYWPDYRESLIRALNLQ